MYTFTYTARMQGVYNSSMAQTRRARSAKDVAYEHLKDRIASIQLDDGRFLTEAEIASDLGVSRTPVREAFLRLEGEGLLRLVPKKGAFVPPVSDREMDDVMETRELIEVHCARKVSTDGTDISRDLDRLLAEQGKLTSDVEAFIECDRRFHDLIVDAAGNGLLTDLYHSLRERQLRMGVRAVVGSPHRARQVIDEHRAIARALAARKAREAEDAVRTHLRATLQILKGES